MNENQTTASFFFFFLYVCLCSAHGNRYILRSRIIDTLTHRHTHASFPFSLSFPFLFSVFFFSARFSPFLYSIFQRDRSTVTTTPPASAPAVSRLHSTSKIKPFMVVQHLNSATKRRTKGGAIYHVQVAPEEGAEETLHRGRDACFCFSFFFFSRSLSFSLSSFSFARSRALCAPIYSVPPPPCPR